MMQELKDYQEELAAEAAEREAEEAAARKAAEEATYAAEIRSAQAADASLAKWLEIHGTVINEEGYQVLGFAEVTEAEVDAYIALAEKVREEEGW